MPQPTTRSLPAVDACQPHCALTHMCTARLARCTRLRGCVAAGRDTYAADTRRDGTPTVASRCRSAPQRLADWSAGCAVRSQRAPAAARSGANPAPPPSTGVVAPARPTAERGESAALRMAALHPPKFRSVAANLRHRTPHTRGNHGDRARQPSTRTCCFEGEGRRLSVPTAAPRPAVERTSFLPLCTAPAKFPV
jgi:hypothetical protein